METPSAGNAPFTMRNTRAAKLTASKVLEIRDFYEMGHVSQGQLARDYGVSVVQIGRIVRGEVWQSLRGAQASPEALADSAARLLLVQQDVERGLVTRLPPTVVHKDLDLPMSDGAKERLATFVRSPLDE